MNRHIHLILAGFVAGITALVPVAGTAEAPVPGSKQARPVVVPGELVVKYSKAASYAARQEIAGKLGGTRKELDPWGDLNRVRLPEGKTIGAALAELRGRPEVEFAEPVYYRYRLACDEEGVDRNCPDDPQFSDQWALHNEADAATDADMDLPEAWFHTTGESGDTGTSDITIAIIDDGFDLDHPDLTGAFDGRTGVSCSEDGCTGDAASTSDNESHGTRVAGTAGAEGDNFEGISGTARVSNILPIRLEDLTSASIAKAIMYAADNGAHIINISLGGPAMSEAEQNAIDHARSEGVLIVAAAGNEDANADQGTAYFPANAPADNMLAVGATDIFDDVSKFSVWGPTTIDVAAPGTNVLSTTLGGGYGKTTGTSFSSPFTAGVAALVAQDLVDGGADPAAADFYRDIKARLMAGAEVDNDSTTKAESKLKGRFITGRVNAHQALESVNELSATGPIMVISDIAVVNDDDGQVDPGETVDIRVTIRNINPDDASGITSFAGELSVAESPNAASALAGSSQAGFNSTSNVGEYEGIFEMAFDGFDGHQRYLLQLDLDHDAASFAESDETRWAWQEAGRLEANNRIRQAAGRDGMNTWDDFQHFHYTADSAADALVFQTSTDHDSGFDTDVDLIVRANDTPEYNITLDPIEGTGSFYVGPRDPDNPETLDPSVRLSGRFDGEESVQFNNVAAGTTYEVVVVNFSDSTFEIDYDLKAVTDPSLVQFTSGAFAVTEGNEATISVERLNATSGDLTVKYVARVEDRLENSASDSDFDQERGTLTWSGNEDGIKTFNVPTSDDGSAGDDKVFQVALSMPGGTRAALGETSVADVTIRDAGEEDDSGSGGDSGGDSGGGGGGGGGPLAPVVLVALGLLGVSRRRG